MYLASLISEAYRNNGLIVAYVYGNMGFGKTSYALWTAYELLGDWGLVLDHLFFDLDRAIDAMYSAVNKNRRLPIMILDDAGYYLNRITWWERDKVLFMEIFNLARTMAAGILFTTPTHEIPRQIAAKSNYRVSVRPLADGEDSEAAAEACRTAEAFNLPCYVSIAKGYRLTVLPSFMKIVKKEYLDYYPLYYPIFDRYQKMRMRAIKRKLQEIRSERAEKRQEIFEKYLEMFRSGVDARKIYKELIKKGIPQRTAWRWAFETYPKLASPPTAAGASALQGGEEVRESVPMPKRGI
jgi:hypothetical protein